MAIGFDVREIIQDPNSQRAQAPQQAATVPMAPVMTPSRSSFNFEDSPLGDIMKAAEPAFKAYLEQKDEETKLEAQMNYAQGEAEEEAKKRGDKYHGAWLSVKAASLGNEAYINDVADIRTKYVGMSTEQYKKEVLAPRFQELAGQMGSDKQSLKLMGAIAGQNYPKLVEEHVKAHQEYNLQQTRTSAYDLISTTAARSDDPALVEQNLIELMRPGTFTLPEPEVTKIFSKAAEDEIKAFKSNKIFTAMNKVVKARYNENLETATSPVFQPLHDAMIGAEGGLNPDGSARVNPRSGASGKYQVLESTWKQPGYGIEPAKGADDQAGIERVGRQLMETFASMYGNDPVLTTIAYHSGEGNLKKNLRALGDPRNGEISYADFMAQYTGQDWTDRLGVQSNTGVETRAHVQKVLDSMGISIDEVSKLDMSGVTNTLSPQSMANYEAIGIGLEDIANLTAANTAMLKERGDTYEINNAIANNAVNLLPAEQQKLANKNMLKQIVDEANTTGNTTEVPEKYISYLHKNNMVDNDIEAKLNTFIDPTVAIGPDGKVSQNAKDAYRWYAALRKVGGGMYAGDYKLDERAQRFLENTFMFAGQAEADDDAFRRAAAIESNIAAGKPLPTTSNGLLGVGGLDSKIKSAMKDWVDTQNPTASPWKRLIATSTGLFTESNMATRSTAIPTDDDLFGGRGGDLRKVAINDPTTSLLIKNSTIRFMQAGWANEKAAVQAAATMELGRSAIVFGQIVRSDYNSTMYKDAGIENFKDVENAFQAGIYEVVSTLGGEMWGSDLPASSNFGEAQFITTSDGKKKMISNLDQSRFNVMYNSDLKMFTIEALNKDKMPIGMPLNIKATDVGAVIKGLYLKQNINQQKQQAKRDAARRAKEQRPANKLSNGMYNVRGNPIPE